MGIFLGILSIPHNIVMSLNNVMNNPCGFGRGSREKIHTQLEMNVKNYLQREGRRGNYRIPTLTHPIYKP
jgi:hypothetical protein